jgi:hypothetical protein
MMTKMNANACPKCGSDDFECREASIEEHEQPLHLFHYLHCNACGHEYRNVFLLIEQQEVVY